MGLVALVVLAGFLGMKAFVLCGASFAAAAFPLTMLALVVGAGSLARRDPFVLVTALVFMLVFFDTPHNFPFNEWEAPSSTLGVLLFDKIAYFTGISPLSLSLFEVLSLALAAWVAFYYGRSELRALVGSARFRVVACLVVAMPVAAGIAVALGLATGGSVGLAMTQARCMPVLGVWLYIGYVATRRPEQIPWVGAAIVAAVTLKCLEGWYAFFVVYGGAMGTREYLMEHITSEQICIALFVVCALWWRFRRHVYHDLAAGLLLVTFLVPYFLNLRRTSFIGMGLTVAMLPLVYPRAVRRRHWIVALSAIAIAGAAVAATWNAPAPLSLVAKPVKRFFTKDEYTGVDYRDVENFNQYAGLTETAATIALGRGFGKHLLMAQEMIDISDSYPLYDVVPHNNVLWIWSNAGPLGMACFGLICAFGIAALIRLGRCATDWRVQLLAFIGWGMVVRWMIWAYGDLGFAFIRLPALVGLVIGMGVRLLGKIEDDRREGRVALATC